MDFLEARSILIAAWPTILDECRGILAGELHYQAMIYYCLRNAGIKKLQIGMNVKQWIDDPVTDLFKLRDKRKHINFRGGFEPVPDIVLFSREIEGDWRRRNVSNTLKYMLCAIEVKASERANGRLTLSEVQSDIAKLAAHRDEVMHRGGNMFPVMMVIDVAPDSSERMRAGDLAECSRYAAAESVAWFYGSPETEQSALPF